MTRGQATIINRLGLHARAAARFVQLAGQFQSAVRVSASGRTTDGKSILGLLLLAAAQGTTVTIEAEGPDETGALEALVALVSGGFEESR